jgi:5-(carboxyamino)imidazole ribonucleotide mutase
MAKVAVIMGSESDRKVVEEAVPFFKYFGIESDFLVMSAHRTPREVQRFAASAEENGYDILIGCAGLAAHLPGVLASYTTLPVLGVPLAGGPFNGQDSLLSIVQMPAGVPVAAMAVGKPGARNAAIFTAQVIARYNQQVASKLKKFKENNCRIP